MQNSELDVMKRLFGRTKDCPALEELISDQLPASISDPDLRIHIDQCLACQAELASWRSFQENEPTSAEVATIDTIAHELDQRLHTLVRAECERPVQAKSSIIDVARAFLRSKQALTASAVFVCSVLLFISLRFQSRNVAPSLSTPSQSQSWRSTDVQVISPTGRLPVLPETLSWKRVPGAAYYRVRVLGVDQAQLWAGTTEITPLRMDADARRALARHSVFLWDVEALDKKGLRLARSGVQR